MLYIYALTDPKSRDTCHNPRDLKVAATNQRSRDTSHKVYRGECRRTPVQTCVADNREEADCFQKVGILLKSERRNEYAAIQDTPGGSIANIGNVVFPM